MFLLEMEHLTLQFLLGVVTPELMAVARMVKGNLCGSFSDCITLYLSLKPLRRN